MKPTDLDLHCLQRQGISGFSRTKVNDRSTLFMSSLREREKRDRRDSRGIGKKEGNERK